MSGGLAGFNPRDVDSAGYSEEELRRSVLHAARCALAQATFDARQACSFLRDDQAEESVKAYLRECQRRGLDPMAILR